MLIICYYVLLVCNILYGIHFLIPTLIGLFKKTRKKEDATKNCKFGILIPARNEEKVIGNLIDSLQRQDYPKENYEIYVLLNNTTDTTKEISLKKNVTILEIQAKGKGNVLKQAFQLLKKETIDAYLIFDADNVVDSKFLSAMNQAYQQGSIVAQGYRDSKNMSDNWLSGGYSLFYFIQNFYYAARKKLHLSAMLSGTGFMIKKECLTMYGYPMQTMTEDMEYTAFCSTHQIPITYVEDAITYDEQPTRFITSWKQRKRWTTGAYQCLKVYWKQLIGSKNYNFMKLDMFYIFFSPLLQVLSCSVGAINVFYILVRDGVYPAIYLGIFFLILVYLAIVLFAIYITKYNHKKISKLKKGIFMFPIFLLTWIPIQFICLFKKEKTWQPIQHTIDVKIEDL